MNAEDTVPMVPAHAYRHQFALRLNLGVPAVGVGPVAWIVRAQRRRAPPEAAAFVEEVLAA